MKFPAIIFFGAFAVRLMAMAYFLPKFKSDVDLDFYHSIARNLAAGNGYVATGSSGRPLPDVGRAPVYPAFLAGLIAGCGDRLTILLAVQCAIGAAICALTVGLARRWLPETAAAVAGAIVAIDPNSIVRCADLRSDTLFSFLIVLIVTLLTRRELWCWGLAGVVCSTAILCRPIATWMWFVVVAVALVQRVRRINLALFLAAVMPLVGAWTARNAALTGYWFVSTASHINLAHNWIVGAEARRVGLEAAERTVTRWYGDLEFFDNRLTFERSLSAVRNDAWKLLRTEPLFVAGQALRGWASVLFGPGARGLNNSLRAPKPAARWWPVLYAVALAALVFLAGRGALTRKRDAAWLWGLALYFVVLVGGPGAGSRFRLPVTPLLAVLAVAGAKRAP